MPDVGYVINVIPMNRGLRRLVLVGKNVQVNTIVTNVSNVISVLAMQHGLLTLVPVRKAVHPVIIWERDALLDLLYMEAIVERAGHIMVSPGSVHVVINASKVPGRRFLIIVNNFFLLLRRCL